MSSNILSDIFDQRTSSYHLLRHNDLVSRQVLLCLLRHSIGPKMWDLEPLEIKQSQRFNMCETKIKSCTPCQCHWTLFWTYMQYVGFIWNKKFQKSLLLLLSVTLLSVDINRVVIIWCYNLYYCLFRNFFQLNSLLYRKKLIDIHANSSDWFLYEESYYR